MQNKKQEICVMALWFFLCFYFMQLFNFPNKLTLLFGGIAILALAIKQKKIRIDLMIFVLTLTIASYFIIVHGQRAFTMALSYVSIIILVLAVYLGYEIHGKDRKETLFITLLITIVIGYSVRGILNSYLFLDGQLQYPDYVRIWKDIWADWYMPGTWQIIFFLPAIACVLPAIVYVRKWKLYSIVLLGINAFFGYIAMASQTRASIIILPLVFCAQVLLYVILERKKVRRYFTKRNIVIAIAFIIISLSAVFFALKDSVIVEKFISIMNRDGGILNNIRFTLQKCAIEQLFEYPMGGKQMVFPQPHPHPHNTWLDMAFVAGLIPFFSFLIYTIFTIFELIQWLIKKEVSEERKVIVAGIYTVFFLYFMIERSFVGSVHYMTPWLFVTGMIHGELCAMKDKLKISQK